MLPQGPAGLFGTSVRELEPDVVVDMICFTLDSARHLIDALRGRIRHFLHCGTIWVHGHSVEVPTDEDQPRRPFGDYGIRKAAMTRLNAFESRSTRFKRLFESNCAFSRDSFSRFSEAL